MPHILFEQNNLPFFGKNIFTKWLPPDPFHNSGSTLKPVRAVWKADTENGAVRGGAERQKLFTMLVLMKNFCPKAKKELAKEGAFR